MLVLHTGSLYEHGLNRIFAFAKRTGFDGVEIVYDAKDRDTRDVAYISELVKQYDLPVRAVSTPRVGCTQKIIEEVLDIAMRLKAPTVVIKAPDWSNFALTSFLRSNIYRWTQQNNVKVCVENPQSGGSSIFPKYAFGNVQDWKRFQYLCLDTAHSQSRGWDLMSTYIKLHDKISHIHLSDARFNALHLVPGRGVVGLESFLTKLKVNNYVGDVSVKISQKLFPVNESETTALLREIRNFYKKYFLDAVVE